MKYNIAHLCLLLSLASCNSKETKTISAPPSEKTETSTVDISQSKLASGTLAVTIARKVELQEDLSNLESFKFNINSYNVHLAAESGHFANSNVECKRKNFSGNKDVERGTFDSTGLHSEVTLSLAATDPSTVDFECLVMDQGQQIDSATITLRKSFIISGKENFFQSIGVSKIQTLLLEENSELNTNGSIVDLEIKELISLKGKITTYNADKARQARANHAGESGGKINLKAETAIGELNIHLKGLQGGIMTRVPPKNTNVPPRDPATNGKCSSRNPGSTHNCPGSQGPVGYRGLTGYQGTKGGNTGSINLEIADSSKLALSITHQPGKGMEGGAGGEGGVGGPGGSGVLVTWYEHQSAPLRKQFPDGPQGVQGPVGLRGPLGDDGVIETSFINLKDQNLNIEINHDWKNL